MRLGLLGPLQVVDDTGVELAIGARKARAVLALLALRPGSVVTPAELIEAVWGDSPPRSAAKTLQTYVSALRRVLPAGAIETTPGGYRLCLSSIDVDIVQFEHSIRDSNRAFETQDLPRAFAALADASALWLGDPLPDLADQRSGRAEAARLTELYRNAEERGLDARLALGEHEQLIGELQAAVAVEPLRERRWEQLMLALYRCGRQADALRAYQQLRTVLNELGLEPGEQVRDLEAAILGRDPHLDYATAERPVTTSGVRTLPSGNVTFLFTDIEGSTSLIQRLGDAYRALLEEHRRMVRSAFRSHDGIEVNTVGDGFLVVFADAGQALAACLEAQQALSRHVWPKDSQFRVRMGIHTGLARPSAAGEYAAVAVHQAARICAAAHGGQTLLSADTARVARHFLPAASSLVDRGLFLLRGFDEPQRIYQLIHPGLQSSFPPLRASPAQSHNLPDMRTSFVGRTADLTAIDDFLVRHRLVSVVGSGGTGKTRVCIEVAARLVPKFEWGIRLCDLSPLSEPARVSSAIAAALGVRERQGPSPSTRGRCRACRPPGVAVARQLRAPDRGRGRGGRRPPGPLPRAAESWPPAANRSGWMASTSGASDRWRSRRRAPTWRPSSAARRPCSSRAGPGWSNRRSPSPRSNAGAVADICRQLDGLPLALELAAAQAGSLSPARSPSGSPTACTCSRRSGPAFSSHRTLDSTVDWSYRLLDEDARRLMRHLAVFANGFTIEAARSVSDADDPVAVLAGLVDKSLVIWDPDAARYRMLEPIRAFARARLEEAGEADAASARHLAWCASLADSLRTTAGDSARRPYDLFGRELDNFRVALSWAAAHQSAEGVRLADAVGPAGLPPVAATAGVDGGGKDEALGVWEVVIGPDRS